MRESVEAVLSGRRDWVYVDPDGVVSSGAGRPTPPAVIAGSFNPVHDGHWELARMAERTLGTAVSFELSVCNADKPPLSAEEVGRRLRQFHGRSSVYVTNAWSFDRKSQLFADCIFVIGADTAERVIDPRYYGADPTAMIGALTAVRTRGGRFFVGGRVDSTGRFVTADLLALPEELRSMFSGPPEQQFRVDISSTALRRQAGSI